MPILIDGHNLIGRLSTISLENPDDEEELVRLLKSYRARTGKAITVVFDPGGAFALPETRRVGGIQVIFAPHGSSADAVIARRVRQSRNPGGLLVVTSDRKLTETVSSQGARAQSSEAFAAQLESGPADISSRWKEDPPSPEEVESWLALFGDQDRQDAVDNAS